MATAAGVNALDAMLSPVILVSSCAIVGNGLLSLYGSVNDRIRSMTKERLEIIASGVAAGSRDTSERLDEIENELPMLLHRHHLLHNALLVLYGAMPLVVSSMFLIALSVGQGWRWAGALALVAVLTATGMLLVTLAFTGSAVRRSQDALNYEVRRVLAVPRTGQ